MLRRRFGVHKRSPRTNVHVSCQMWRRSAWLCTCKMFCVVVPPTACTVSCANKPVAELLFWMCLHFRISVCFVQAARHVACLMQVMPVQALIYRRFRTTLAHVCRKLGYLQQGSLWRRCRAGEAVRLPLDLFGDGSAAGMSVFLAVYRP